MDENFIKDLDKILFSEEKPVDFRTFVESPDYCNTNSMYEFWFEETSQIKNNVTEIVVTGSLGGGKTISCNTPISFDKGYLTYRDFKVCCNTTFIGEDSKGTKCWNVSGIKAEQTDGSFRDVTKLYYNPKWKLNRIHSKFGKDLEISDDHPVLCLKKGLLIPTLVKGKDIKVGDYILYRKPITFSLSKDRLDLVKHWAYGYFVCGVLRSPETESRHSLIYDLAEDLKTSDLNSLNPSIFSSKSRAFSFLCGYLNASINFEGVNKLLTTKKMKDALQDVLSYLSIPYYIQRYSNIFFNFEIVITSYFIDYYKDLIEELYRDISFYGINFDNFITVCSEMYSQVKPESLFDLKQFEDCPDNRLLSEANLNGSFNKSLYRDYIFSEVQEITTFTGKKWDIEVDETHMFMSNNVPNHNSWWAAYYLAYRLYLLFFGGNPHQKLGIPEDDPVYILYFSLSLSLAKRSGFQYIFNVFKHCKWFKNNCPIDPNLTSSIRFANGFSIEYASDFGHQVGLNVWGFILDEANFRSGVGEGLVSEYSEVTELYTQLLDRQVSRFSEVDSVNALAILLSSASYQSSFVETRKQAIKDSPYARYIRVVAYKVKPEKYSKEKFEVFIGAGSLEPKIIEDSKDKNLVIRQLKMEGLPDMYDDYFEEVPVSIKKFYLSNISLALQNHSGISTQISGQLFKDINILKKTYNYDLPKFFYQDELTMSTGDDLKLIDFVNLSDIQFPERPHSFFFDLSVSGDVGGFSCFRFDGVRERLRLHTHVFTVGIVPPPSPYATRIAKMRDFMNDISEFVNVTAFGTDNFQSIQLRQDITSDLNLDNIRLSIDSSDMPFLHWMRGLVEGQIVSYYNQNLETEAIEAEHDLKKRRVLKKKGSTDDLIQSVVGAYWLSDTVSSTNESLEDLHGNINVVGSRSYIKMLNKLGYK